MGTSKARLECRLAGVFGGLCLMAGNIYGPLAPLQLFGFTPLLVMMLNKRCDRTGYALAGLYMGLAFTLPQMIILKMPLIITVILLIDLTLVIFLMIWLFSCLMKDHYLWNIILFPVLLVVLDWSNYMILPMWGTAQSLGRCWSAYPAWIQYVSITGVEGVIFMSGLVSIMIAYGIIGPHRLRTACIVTGIVVLVILSALAPRLFPVENRQINVAVVGWATNTDQTERDQVIYDDERFERYYVQSIRIAAEQNAHLVVTPELGMEIDLKHAPYWLSRLGQLARENHVFLAIGYLNSHLMENRILFMDDQGQVVGEYTKTHLTPFEQSFKAGEGSMTIIDIDGIRVGGMVCQDDNFTDLSRSYGNGGVDLVVVPTLDWDTVKTAHLQNSILRCIESRYAIARAALNGISAIVSNQGHVHVQCDHFREGLQVITASVEFNGKPTLYDQYGNWLVWLCAIILGIMTVMRVLTKKSDTI